MNFHNITTADMMNGEGLRVVLWLSGCSHKCNGCHNQQTWDAESGILFDELAKEELFEELGREYIHGITFSGGDPLHENNVKEVLGLIIEIKNKFPNKNIWLYTGYRWESLFLERDDLLRIHYDKIRREVVSMCDVVVDGRYIDALRDVNAHWVGSSNQRVIDAKRSLVEDKVVLYE